ncbi:hypothetical protein AB1Y20_009999 [Prymnesium parvum]|uniref:Amino acid transporter transmembrane domain-containing protein n=1 Tax=Prymnesium parvum TaxID=97485 RepID=A0AB34K665_PRYPA
MSHFMYANMPGDSSDEEASPANAAPATRRNISSGIHSQTNPQFGSTPVTGSIRTSATFDGALPSISKGVTNLIDASLSVHNISLYTNILSSSGHLEAGHLLSDSPVDLGALSAHMTEPVVKPLTASLHAHIFFAVIKSYVGPAILYLPHAFNNGGMLASALTIPMLGALVSVTFSGLAQCHISSPGFPTYGDMAQLALGKTGYIAVQTALCVAQLATCTSYYMFVSRNVRDSLELLGCHSFSSQQIIPALVIIFTPMALVKSIRHLAITNIIADLLILGGLSFVAYYATAVLASNDGEPAAPVERLFNPHGFLLFLGTSCFTFEGSGLMIPIVSSLEPEYKSHFSPIFHRAMLTTVLLFSSFGALCYSTFGSSVILPVTLNVDAGVGPGVAIRLGYSIAVVFTYPLQLLPIADILEAAISHPPAPCATITSLARRLLSRLLLIALTCLVAIFGAAEFDHFISLVGATCGVPLAFVLPNLIYLKLAPALGCAVVWRLVAARIGVVVGIFGVIAGGGAALASWSQR